MKGLIAKLSGKLGGSGEEELRTSLSELLKYLENAAATTPQVQSSQQDGEALALHQLAAAKEELDVLQQSLQQERDQTVLAEERAEAAEEGAKYMQQQQLKASNSVAHWHQKQEREKAEA
eukprot:CAMPEP_0183363160 /NCGR_PEP_ID=MMETSP0164_2-20130417/73673_1 /TAXON_ID=221442 /ORGANISM="Coccolithus pelagicus ssp braarudi, Strain PLY182g" /LENGTH=119 /DNA_ID=CAMNT_0025538193 /DNA_START=80 /DNA_END=436 /DNA_ORIENTATION=+